MYAAFEQNMDGRPDRDHQKYWHFCSLGHRWGHKEKVEPVI